MDGFTESVGTRGLSGPGELLRLDPSVDTWADGREMGSSRSTIGSFGWSWSMWASRSESRLQLWSQRMHWNPLDATSLAYSGFLWGE